VTAASLFDGHDAAINVMRRLMQASGAEVIHLGHNRSVDEVVTDTVLSGLYRMPIEVLRVNGRILVVAAHGAVEAEAHRHDADGPPFPDV